MSSSRPIGRFGDGRITIQHIAAVNDMIAGRWELADTHDGNALYGSASGEAVYILAVSLWRIDCGVVVDDVTVLDEVPHLHRRKTGEYSGLGTFEGDCT